MTRPAALLDAALTVQGWRRLRRSDWIMRHVARDLHCYPAWAEIQDEIVRLLLEGEPIAVPLQLAA